jgi:hypothetical protein
VAGGGEATAHSHSHGGHSHASAAAAPGRQSAAHRRAVKILIADFAGVLRGRALRNVREALGILEAPWVDPSDLGEVGF